MLGKKNRRTSIEGPERTLFLSSLVEFKSPVLPQSMGSINKNRVGFPSHHHSPSIVCTRTHQIGALALVVTTFFLTRLLDHHRPLPPPSFKSHYIDASQAVNVGSSGDGFPWPDRGYGSRLDLKIYVYEEDEIDGLKELMRGRDGKISAASCVKGQWGTQVKIHQFLLQSRFRTLKKEDADFFFVPSYVKCVRMMGGLNDKEINQTYVKVLSQMPYFRRSGGRDHIFIFPSGAGAHLFRSWSTYLNRSIILTPEGDRTDKRDTSAFNTWKDIIIPGNVDDGMTKADGDTLVQPLPLSKRKHLSNFLGRAQGKVGRLQLVELAKQFPDKSVSRAVIKSLGSIDVRYFCGVHLPHQWFGSCNDVLPLYKIVASGHDAHPDILIHQGTLESPELKFSGPDKLGRTDYFLHLRNAKFCLSPRGESSWTLRFYESFFVECVPVVLSDQAELPFQSVIDYTKISIKWPSTRISSELLDYLQSIPDEEIERMIANGRQVKCLWVYAPESAPCSAMLGIMWELQRKVRRFHQSAETFWLHNRSIVNRNLVDFHDWKPPMPLP